MNSETIVELSVESIDPNPFQPRLNFSGAALQSLADSITLHGMFQPIICRRSSRAGRFELIEGERRVRALRKLCHDKVRAIVRAATDLEVAEISLIINDQREELDPLERAIAYERVLQMSGITQEALGQRLGRSQPFVNNHLRLLDLPNDWRNRLAARQIDPSHARIVLQIARFPEVLAEFEQRVNWSERPSFRRLREEAYRSVKFCGHGIDEARAAEADPKHLIRLQNPFTKEDECFVIGELPPREPRPDSRPGSELAASTKKRGLQKPYHFDLERRLIVVDGPCTISVDEVFRKFKRPRGPNRRRNDE